MGMFRVTYEIVTDESAEHGDAAEIGFMLPGGWYVTLEQALADKEGDYSMTLREAVSLATPNYDAGTWLGELDGNRTLDGAWQRRDLHPPRNITPASYKRLKRALRIN